MDGCYEPVSAVKILRCVVTHIDITEFQILSDRKKSFVIMIFIPPANEVWGVYRNHPVCLSVRLSVRLSVQSKLNLDYNF